MASAITTILKKFDIYLDRTPISKELLLEKYLSFFADTMQEKKPAQGFALHTGSICFDALSIVAVSMGCLSHMVSTIDDILSTLREDDPVIYNGQRHRWKGTTTINEILHLGLKKDATKKDSALTRWLPYDAYKHHIKPYYGDAQTTNGIGIRDTASNREDFLAYILSRPATEIPPHIDISVVIACARERFSDVFKRIYIQYGNGQTIDLADILPASYYTDTDRSQQIGSNPTKAEPALKVTSSLSIARDLIYEKGGNTVVGFLSLLDKISTTDTEDLDDILRAPALKFTYITAPIYSRSYEQLIEQHTDAAVFACTKAFLAENLGRFHMPYIHTKDMIQQAESLKKNSITPIPVKRGLSQAEYKKTRNILDVIRSAHWDGPEKDIFLGTAHSLLNLFITAAFSMEEMEIVLSTGLITITSPRERLQSLRNIADRTHQSLQEKCAQAADMLEHQYGQLYSSSPKREALLSCLNDCCKPYHRTDLAVIVPKAYYTEILKYHHKKIFDRNNISCVTPAKFDPTGGYAYVISVGELKDKKYNPTACLSASNIYTLLAPCEDRFFAYRKYTSEKYEQFLNTRMGLTVEAKHPAESELDTFAPEELQEFADRDGDLSDFKIAALRSFTSPSSSDGQGTISEVTHIGLFTNGARILFSKYYTAVVFDPIHETVTEKKAGDLSSGDTLVFTKRDHTTKNIVDTIYEILLHDGYLEENAAGVLAKSLYWKTVLRSYKNQNGLTYSDLASRLEARGSTLKEATIRQWLLEEAHIIGPRKISALESIASMTKDPFLLANTQSYYEACERIRSTRRKILTHIAAAIHAQLSGTCTSSDAISSIVSAHIEKLSETMKLDDILQMDEPFHAKSGLVNRPITEEEITL